MKKIIIMSLAFFAFALVGCGDKDDSKDEDAKKAECDKDATKQWNAEKKECEAKAAAAAAAADYTIKNSLAAGVVKVSADGYNEHSVAVGKCVTVKADAANVKIAIDGEAEALCDADAATADVSDCKAANQEVKETTAADANATPPVVAENGLADLAAAAENCEAMVAATQ